MPPDASVLFKTLSRTTNLLQWNLPKAETIVAKKKCPFYGGLTEIQFWTEF